MRNPVRVGFEKVLGWDFDADVAETTNVQDLRKVRAVCKLWIGGFATIAALTGWGLLKSHNIDVEITPDNWAATVAEKTIEGAIIAPWIGSGVLALAGCAEGARMNQVVTQRLNELEN